MIINSVLLLTSMAFLPPPPLSAIAQLIAANLGPLVPAGCDMQLKRHPKEGYVIYFYVANATIGALIANNLLSVIGIAKNIIPLTSVEVRGGFELKVDAARLEKLYPDETKLVDGRIDLALRGCGLPPS